MAIRAVEIDEFFHRKCVKRETKVEETLLWVACNYRETMMKKNI
jgi:hypothetical protein